MVETVFLIAICRQSGLLAIMVKPKEKNRRQLTKILILKQSKIYFKLKQLNSMMNQLILVHVGPKLREPFHVGVFLYLTI